MQTNGKQVHLLNHIRSKTSPYKYNPGLFPVRAGLTQVDARAANVYLTRHQTQAARAQACVRVNINGCFCKAVMKWIILRNCCYR